MSITTVTATTLREKLKSYLDRVSTSLETLIVSRGRDERDTVVIMSLDMYNALTETNYLLSTAANRDRLLGSIEEAKAGKVSIKKMEDIEKLISKKKNKRNGK